MIPNDLNYLICLSNVFGELTKIRETDKVSTKYKKASKSYTSIIRSLNKSSNEDVKIKFQTIYKKTFDEALLNEEKDPEEMALDKAVEYLDSIDKDLVKNAGAIQMGSPEEAGKFLAAIISFLMRRISHSNRQKSILNLKNKIRAIDEHSIAAKRMPASASLGQAITLVKTVLMTHSPNYIRATLNSITSNL